MSEEALDFAVEGRAVRQGRLMLAFMKLLSDSSDEHIVELDRAWEQAGAAHRNEMLSPREATEPEDAAALRASLGLAGPSAHAGQLYQSVRMLMRLSAEASSQPSMAAMLSKVISSLEDAPMAVFLVTKAEGRIAYCGGTALTRANYVPADVIGKTIYETLPADSPVIAAYLRAFEGEDVDLFHTSEAGASYLTRFRPVEGMGASATTFDLDALQAATAV